MWTLIDDECKAKSLFDAIVDIYDLNKAKHLKPFPDIGSGIARDNSDAAVTYSESDIFGRYTSVSGPIMRTPSTSDALVSSSLLTYDATLQHTFKGAIFPLFVTMISGSIGPEGNESDLNSVPFLRQEETSMSALSDMIAAKKQMAHTPFGRKSTLPLDSSNLAKKVTLVDKSYSPFAWRSRALGEKLSIGVLSNVTKYVDVGIDPEEDLSSSELNSFSFMSIPSLDSTNEMVVGVINPDGTPVRKRSFAPLGYTVVKEGYGIWKIKFKNAFQKAPTLIAQPTWTSSPKDMPKSSAQVSLAVRDCSEEECTIYMGSENFIEALFEGRLCDVSDDAENAFVNNHLGISFLALDGNLTSPSVLHGTVRMPTSPSPVFGNVPSAVPSHEPSYSSNPSSRPSSSSRKPLYKPRSAQPTAFANNITKGWTEKIVGNSKPLKYNITILPFNYEMVDQDEDDGSDDIFSVAPPSSEPSTTPSTTPSSEPSLSPQPTLTTPPKVGTNIPMFLKGRRERLAGIVWEQNYTFVEISFQEEFLETPTVIVTPRFENSTMSYPFKRIQLYHDEHYYLEKKTFASIEYISTRKALIKVGLTDTIGLGNNITDAKLFEALSFSFMVVGPILREEAKKPDEVSYDVCKTDYPSTSPSSYGKGKGKRPTPSPSTNLRSKVPTPYSANSNITPLTLPPASVVSSLSEAESSLQDVPQSSATRLPSTFRPSSLPLTTTILVGLAWFMM